MEFPPVTLAEWRALVEKELAGKSFEKALAHEALEGIRIAPLYTERPAHEVLVREPRAGAFRICTRHGADARREEIEAELREGADAVWLPLGSAPSGLLERKDGARGFAVFEVEGALGSASSVIEALERVAGPAATEPGVSFALGLDPLAQRARGGAVFETLSGDLAALGRVAQRVDECYPGSTAVRVSSLPYHDAGADVADELAFVLATGAEYVEALLGAGLSPARAARQISLQLVAGRDTFVELCKLRALRVVWRKLLVACGVPGGELPHTLVHAVGSARTLTVRDPWVNLLRVTTQVFAAALGGADLITPSPFDQAFGPPSVLGRRTARNTGLVLREESALGQVTDPAGGSYYFESLTEALAREAWRRFQVLMKEGGIAAALTSGRLAARLEAEWRAQRERIAKRKTPILGVSEFANLGEELPRPAPPASEPVVPAGALPLHRDAAGFESLRARAEAKGAPEVLLVTLGAFADSRARVGFAVNFFAAGGLRTRESTQVEPARTACLCGTDEHYAAEAAAMAQALKAAGCSYVLLAGRPGALEPVLRAAGVDGFIFVGCDVLATLSALLELP